MSEWDLHGKVIIVTGASSGIGEAVARALAAAGAHPVLAARRADRLATLSEELGGALAVPTDVTEPDDIRRLIDATVERHGRVDGLINNAGVSLHEPLATVDLDRFREVLDLNVLSVIAVTQAVLPGMRATGGGRIVNISSGTTRMTLPGVGAYAATKSALNMLTAVLRVELAEENILVSAVLPSMTATEFGTGDLEPGQEPRPGMVVHSGDYVARFVLRAVRAGEGSIDVPHGPEQGDI